MTVTDRPALPARTAAARLIVVIRGTSADQYAPVLETLSREMAGRLKVVKVNVDEAPATAQRYKAMSIPMLLIMDRGQVVDTLIGAQPAPMMRARIQGALDRRG